MAELRLQRFLAKAGVASRRKSEELILQGKVSVNGKVVRELGTRVDSRRDRVTFEGQRVLPEKHVWLLMNKPVRTVCSLSDPEGRETVMDLVKERDVRLYPVGRLDFNTQGVLLLTNDGDLAHGLMHPRNQVPRAYHVKVQGFVTPEALDRLQQGVTLDTGETVSAKVGMVGGTDKNTWIEMVLFQGLNHQIHRMLDCVGLSVLKLVRVAYGPLTTKGLPYGATRHLTQKEVDDLRELVNLPGQSVQRPKPSGGRRGFKPRPKKGGPPRSEKPRPKKAGPPRSEKPRPKKDGSPRSVKPRPKKDGPPRSAKPRPKKDGPPRSGKPRPKKDGPPRSGKPRPKKSGHPRSDGRKSSLKKGPPARKRGKGPQKSRQKKTN